MCTNLVPPVFQLTANSSRNLVIDPIRFTKSRHPPTQNCRDAYRDRRSLHTRIRFRSIYVQSEHKRTHVITVTDEKRRPLSSGVLGRSIQPFARSSGDRSPVTESPLILPVSGFTPNTPLSGHVAPRSSFSFFTVIHYQERLVYEPCSPSSLFHTVFFPSQPP